MNWREALISPRHGGEWHRLYTASERGTLSRALLVAPGGGERAMPLDAGRGIAHFWAAGLG